MTDRINTVTVFLERDTRSDDAETIIAAISMIKGVASVMPGQPVGLQDISNRMQVAAELRAKMWDLLKP